MCLTSVEVYEIGNWCEEKSGHNTIKDSDLLASHQKAVFDWDNSQQFLQVCLSGWILWVNAEMHEKVRSDSGMNEQNLLITVTHIYTHTPTYNINDPSLKMTKIYRKVKRAPSSTQGTIEPKTSRTVQTAAMKAPAPRFIELQVTFFYLHEYRRLRSNSRSGRHNFRR